MSYKCKCCHHKRHHHRHKHHKNSVSVKSLWRTSRFKTNSSLTFFWCKPVKNNTKIRKTKPKFIYKLSNACLTKSPPKNNNCNFCTLCTQYNKNEFSLFFVERLLKFLEYYQQCGQLYLRKSSYKEFIKAVNHIRQIRNKKLQNIDQTSQPEASNESEGYRQDKWCQMKYAFIQPQKEIRNVEKIDQAIYKSCQKGQNKRNINVSNTEPETYNNDYFSVSTFEDFKLRDCDSLNNYFEQFSSDACAAEVGGTPSSGTDIYNESYIEFVIDPCPLQEPNEVESEIIEKYDNNGALNPQDGDKVIYEREALNTRILTSENEIIKDNKRYKNMLISNNDCKQDISIPNKNNVEKVEPVTYSFMKNIDHIDEKVSKIEDKYKYCCLNKKLDQSDKILHQQRDTIFRNHNKDEENSNEESKHIKNEKYSEEIHYEKNITESSKQKDAANFKVNGQSISHDIPNSRNTQGGRTDNQKGVLMSNVNLKSKTPKPLPRNLLKHLEQDPETVKKLTSSKKGNSICWTEENNNVDITFQNEDIKNFKTLPRSMPQDINNTEDIKNEQISQKKKVNDNFVYERTKTKNPVQQNEQIIEEHNKKDVEDCKHITKTIDCFDYCRNKCFRTLSKPKDLTKQTEQQAPTKSVEEKNQITCKESHTNHSNPKYDGPTSVDKNKYISSVQAIAKEHRKSISKSRNKDNEENSFSPNLISDTKKTKESGKKYKKDQKPLLLKNRINDCSNDQNKKPLKNNGNPYYNNQNPSNKCKGKQSCQPTSTEQTLELQQDQNHKKTNCYFENITNSHIKEPKLNMPRYDKKCKAKQQDIEEITNQCSEEQSQNVELHNDSCYLSEISVPPVSESKRTKQIPNDKNQSSPATFKKEDYLLKCKFEENTLNGTKLNSLTPTSTKSANISTNTSSNTRDCDDHSFQYDNSTKSEQFDKFNCNKEAITNRDPLRISSYENIENEDTSKEELFNYSITLKEQLQSKKETLHYLQNRITLSPHKLLKCVILEKLGVFPIGSNLGSYSDEKLKKKDKNKNHSKSSERKSTRIASDSSSKESSNEQVISVSMDYSEKVSQSSKQKSKSRSSKNESKFSEPSGSVSSKSKSSKNHSLKSSGANSLKHQFESPHYNQTNKFPEKTNSEEALNMTKPQHSPFLLSDSKEKLNTNGQTMEQSNSEKSNDMPTFPVLHIDDKSCNCPKPFPRKKKKYDEPISEAVCGKIYDNKCHPRCQTNNLELFFTNDELPEKGLSMTQKVEKIKPRSDFCSVKNANNEYCFQGNIREPFTVTEIKRSTTPIEKIKTRTNTFYPSKTEESSRRTNFISHNCANQECECEINSKVPKTMMNKEQNKNENNIFYQTNCKTDFSNDNLYSQEYICELMKDLPKSQRNTVNKNKNIKDNQLEYSNRPVNENINFRNIPHQSKAEKPSFTNEIHSHPVRVYKTEIKPEHSKTPNNKNINFKNTSHENKDEKAHLSTGFTNETDLSHKYECETIIDNKLENSKKSTNKNRNVGNKSNNSKTEQTYHPKSFNNEKCQAFVCEPITEVKSEFSKNSVNQYNSLGFTNENCSCKEDIDHSLKIKRTVTPSELNFIKDKDTDLRTNTSKSNKANGKAKTTKCRDRGGLSPARSPLLVNTESKSNLNKIECDSSFLKNPSKKKRFRFSQTKKPSTKDQEKHKPIESIISQPSSIREKFHSTKVGLLGRKKYTNMSSEANKQDSSKAISDFTDPNSRFSSISKNISFLYPSKSTNRAHKMNANSRKREGYKDSCEPYSVFLQSPKIKKSSQSPILTLKEPKDLDSKSSLNLVTPDDALYHSNENCENLQNPKDPPKRKPLIPLPCQKRSKKNKKRKLTNSNSSKVKKAISHLWFKSYYDK